jgi:signal transduction histidine kinase
VSLDRDEVLYGWRIQVVESALFFGVLAVMMAGTLVALLRQMDQKNEVERALARTQREEADRLRAANDRLEKALRMEQEFLMTVSHELRTPLTAIRGWARMLATGAVQGEQQAAAIQSIERNARAQTRLVEDLLDMARVDGGTLRLDIKEVSLPEVVREAVETMTPAADAKNIRVETIVEGARGHHRRRPRSPAADRREPAVERDQVHAERRDVWKCGWRRRRPRLDHRPRHGRGHLTRIPAARVRPVSPGRRRAASGDSAASASVSPSSSTWWTCTADRSS